MTVVTRCYGSCGELFQGVVDKEEYLLSYQIDRYSELTAYLGKESIPFPKINKAVKLLQEKRPLTIQHYTNLPIGKGCASSTSDIVATLKAVSLLQEKQYHATFLTQLSTQIEPSDSVAFSNWTAIHPLTGQIHEQFSWQPIVYVYMLEPLATVLTASLPRLTECRQYDTVASYRLYNELKQAINRQDLHYLANVTTQLAWLNEVRLKKPYLREIIAFAKKNKLLGINIAHSGTVIGLLLDEKDILGITELEQAIQHEKWSNYYETRQLCKVVYEGVKQYAVNEIIE